MVNNELLVAYYKSIGVTDCYIDLNHDLMPHIYLVGGVVTSEIVFNLEEIETDYNTCGEGQYHTYAKAHRITGAIDSYLESIGIVLPQFRWRPHQIAEGTKLYHLLYTYGWGMLRHMPRTGKTGSLLYALEMFPTMNVLINTTKNGVKGIKGSKGGWLGFIELAQSAGWCSKHSYHITTPHQIHKQPHGHYDLVVMDESHKIYSDPKPTATALWANARMVIGDARVAFVTATPHAQSINQLYWQLMLCAYNPFIVNGLDTWKAYFGRFGEPYTILIGNGVAIPQWDKGDIDGIYALMGYGVLTLSQEEVGFDSGLLPINVPHYIGLNPELVKLMRAYEKDEMMKVGDVMVHTLNSRDIQLRLHQMEGGTLKYVDVFSILDEATGVRRRGVKPVTHNWTLPWMDKVAYIKERWGDTEDMVIMYHYVNEGKLLRREFKNAKVYQGRTHSEAIDLYMYENLIIYSMDWSVATDIQRKDRQVHLTKRKTAIEVHYLLVQGGISDDIYDAVVKRGVDLTHDFYGKDGKGSGIKSLPTVSLGGVA